MLEIKKFLSYPFTQLSGMVRFNDFMFAIQNIIKLFSRILVLETKVDKLKDRFGNVWYVAPGQVVTIESYIENVVSKMDVDGNLIIEGKLTTGI